MNEGKNILLAEDDAQDAELILSALADLNLATRVEHVRDGAEALDYLFRRGKFAMRLKGNPDLVLLDLKMPKVNGIEVLHQIKADKKLKPTPVVVLTSSREPRGVSSCYDYGANAYVVKPLALEDFTSAVKKTSSFWMLVNEPPP